MFSHLDHPHSHCHQIHPAVVCCSNSLHMYRCQCRGNPANRHAHDRDTEQFLSLQNRCVMSRSWTGAESLSHSLGVSPWLVSLIQPHSIGLFSDGLLTWLWHHTAVWYSALRTWFLKASSVGGSIAPVLSVVVAILYRSSSNVLQGLFSFRYRSRTNCLALARAESVDEIGENACIAGYSDFIP